MERVHGALHRDMNHVKGYSNVRTQRRVFDGDPDSSRGIELTFRYDLVPKCAPIDIKLCWLRSQIIGSDSFFDTPFGRRRLTYADHTASGRSLHYVESYIATNILPFYGNTHTSDSYVGEHTTKMVTEATNYVKKCHGGGEEDAIIFCGSGSTAAIKRLQEVMGIVVPSILRERVLNFLSDEKRWVVFIGPYEHHSNILSWRQSLAEVVEIGLDDRTGSVDMEDLRQKLELYKSQNRPLLGSFSACSNVTGICSDTRGIARLLHRYRGFACFDFAASGPYIDIEMRSRDNDGYDAIYLSTHKFLGGPGSPGILLMNKALYLLGAAPPSTCGGGTVKFVSDHRDEDTLYEENIEEREDAGTPPIIQKIRAALAFRIKEWVGQKHIEWFEEIYIRRTLERLLPNPNIYVLGNTTSKRQAILSFLIYPTAHSEDKTVLGRDKKTGLDLWGVTRGKPLHGPFVAKLLNDIFGIQARGGCACAGPYGHRLLNVDESHSFGIRSLVKKGYVGIKPGWTRVSFPYYMSLEEFEFILAAIEFLSVYGQRFLPLYHFNWRTGAWVFNKSALSRNNTGSSSSLGNLIKSLNLESNKKQINMKEEVIHRYTSYLEAASHIANLLPNFPPQRSIAEGIDDHFVPFRL